MVNYIFLFGLITRAYTAQGTRQEHVSLHIQSGEEQVPLSC